MSLLEGVFARGDRRLSALLVYAWKKGCRLDGWSDMFRYDLWEEAFMETGIDPDFFTSRKRDDNEVLPWDHIDSAAYQPWEPAPENISELQQHSAVRIKENKDFQEIISDANSAKQRREETQQSLLLKDILAERDQLHDEKERMAPHGAMADDDEKKTKTLDEEIADRRLRELQEGKVKTIPAEEVWKELGL